MRCFVISMFLSEILCGFSCFQKKSFFDNSGSNHFNYILGEVVINGTRSYSELYEESDDIDDMIENNDDYILVNDNSKYSGENLMDGKRWRTRRIQLREKKIKHNAL